MVFSFFDYFSFHYYILYFYFNIWKLIIIPTTDEVNDQQAITTFLKLFPHKIIKQPLPNTFCHVFFICNYLLGLIYTINF